jgi:K+ transporter
MPIDLFIESIAATACACRARGFPHQHRIAHAALLLSLKHNKVLHERVVLLTMTTGSDRYARRVQMRDLGCNFQQFEAFSVQGRSDVPGFWRKRPAAVSRSTCDLVLRRGKR